VAVGTMGIGLDFGGFGVEALPKADVQSILSVFPRLRLKQRFTDACCRLVTSKPETSNDKLPARLRRAICARLQSCVNGRPVDERSVR